MFVCVGAEASTTQPESSSEEEEERPSSHGVASESSDSEDDQGTVDGLFISDGSERYKLHVYELQMKEWINKRTSQLCTQLKQLRKESL